ncbi:MAG: pantoate--beta-alanine ligase [Rhodothermales bacterium]
MPVITSVSRMQSWADARRAEGRRLGLVPTMGALHAGHLALVREAVERADDVVVSNFVNPTQFGPNEDYERYPRESEHDIRLLKEIDPSIVTFAPTVGEIYPDGVEASRTWVEVDELDRHLCGRFREGHFRGVTTVVMKLLHACKPDVAVFGLKDAQQFVIIDRMVRDMLLDVEIVGVPIVREADGLAYSSRNVYLTPEQRASATMLSQAVEEAERRILKGEQRSGPLVESMRSVLDGEEDLEVQYVEVVHAATLQPVEVIDPGQRVLAAVAAYVGATRLIDNVFVRAP